MLYLMLLHGAKGILLYARRGESNGPRTRARALSRSLNPALGLRLQPAEGCGFEPCCAQG